jgi:hypothetical protein
LKQHCIRAAKALLFVLLLASTLPFITAGCGADTTRADEGFRDWQDVEFSEETVNREYEERALDLELRTEDEKRDEILKEYEGRLIAARAEEERLVSKLADIRDIEALSELSEELRADYTALAAETEAEIAALRDEIDRIEKDAENISAINEPPEEESWEFEESEEFER